MGQKREARPRSQYMPVVTDSSGNFFTAERRPPREAMLGGLAGTIARKPGMKAVRDNKFAPEYKPLNMNMEQPEIGYGTPKPIDPNRKALGAQVGLNPDMYKTGDAVTNFARSKPGGSY